MPREEFPLGRILTIGALVFCLIAGSFLAGSIVENVDANEIVLIQSVGGELTWHTTPGIVMQNFGKVTRYQKRGIIKFAPAEYEGYPDGRLPLVFNDGGNGKVKGSINYELPLNPKQLTELHSFYSTQEALEQSLVKPALNKSVYLTGTLMTSYESYKEKRSALIQFVEDQTQNGVYRTKTVNREVDEETLGPDGLPRITKKQVSAVEIETNANGQQVRAEAGQLARFGVKAFNFAIEDLEYEASVKKQLAQQQELAQAVQTSIAKAKQAQQDAVTAEATGRANIAQARAEQEITKTQAVVQGEKERDVARLKSEQAEFYKKEQLLRAEADASYRRQIMQADNALDRRLKALENINATWANAFKEYKGTMVPNVVMGGGGSANAASGVQNFMDLLSAKAARDLGIEANAR